MRSEEEDTFICWRHDYGGSQGCGLNPQQLLSVMATGEDCDSVRRRWSDDKILHYHAWREAVDRELIGYKAIPYSVALGYAREQGMVNYDEKLVGGLYWEVINSIKVEVEKDYIY